MVGSTPAIATGERIGAGGFSSELIGLPSGDGTTVVLVHEASCVQLFSVGVRKCRPRFAELKGKLEDFAEIRK